MENVLIVEKPWIWREALYKSDLPASALRVGLALVEKFLNRATGNVFPSHETIAAECRMSIETVRTGLKALKEFGMVTTRKSGFNSSLNYLLHAAVVISRDAKGVLANWSKLTTRTGQIQPLELVKSDHLTLEGNLSKELLDDSCRDLMPHLGPSAVASLHSDPAGPHQEADVEGDFERIASGMSPPSAIAIVSAIIPRSKSLPKKVFDDTVNLLVTGQIDPHHAKEIVLNEAKEVRNGR